MKIGVRKGGVWEWWSSCQVPSADLAFLSLSASSQSWSQSSYLLGTVSGGKAAVVYYNVYIYILYIVSLVLNWLSNLEFRRRKKVVQVVQIGGRGGGGNLDKIQKNSRFFRETFPYSPTTKITLLPNVQTFNLPLNTTTNQRGYLCLKLI